MLTDYIRAAMAKAHYEILPEDKRRYGEIPGVQGAWASEATLEGCREELLSTLEDWILLRLHRGATLPVIEGVDLNSHQVASAESKAA